MLLCPISKLMLAQVYKLYINDKKKKVVFIKLSNKQEEVPDHLLNKKRIKANLLKILLLSIKIPESNKLQPLYQVLNPKRKKKIIKTRKLESNR